MHFFFIRYVVFLLSVLTWNSTVAHGEDVSRTEITRAKVLINYLKVPWINLNSSWNDQVSSPCRDDIATLVESADAGEMWALQMLDAASKIPSGILIGNIYDLGMYDECIRVKADENPAKIQGRHCMVSLSMPPKFVGDATAALYLQKFSAYNPTPHVELSFSFAVCLPSTCGVQDVTALGEVSIQGKPELAQLEVKVARVTCSGVGAGSDNLPQGTILAISFFAVVAILLLFCTACEFTMKDNSSPVVKTLAKFSLYTNSIQLLSTKISPGTMPAINGIRFFGLLSVLMIHRLMAASVVKPQVNPGFLVELRQSWITPFLILPPVTIETFLEISGYLTAYWFLTKLRYGKKVNVLVLYLHRFLRLTPCLAALLLFDVHIVPYLGSGPLWEITSGVTTDFCRKNWWTNLLNIQNFVNSNEMCMPHTWYSAAEMHLLWLCPMILYPLHYRPKLGLLILSLFSFASLIVPTVQLIVNQYSLLPNLNKAFEAQFQETMDFYILTYNRALPYFVGVGLGYYVVNTKRKLTKAEATFNWILAGICVLFVVWSSYFIAPIAVDYNVVWEAIFVSVGRLAWSFATAWFLYACTQGYGGPVTRFLSLPIFVPISRMSYGVYLLGIVIQGRTNATAQTAEFTSKLTIMWLVLGDLVLSFMAAFVFNLCFESPIAVLEKLFKAKQPSDKIENSLTEKKEKLLAIIHQCPDMNNVQNDSDSSIEIRMLQPEFWRIVSKVLETSGKGPTKTPSEWVKTWQDWKSYLSQSDSQSNSTENDTENRSDKVETGISKLEKELLIFLATVSCGVGDVESVEDLEHFNSAASQSGSHGSENQAVVQLPKVNSTDLRRRRFIDGK